MGLGAGEEGGSGRAGSGSRDGALLAAAFASASCRSAAAISAAAACASAEPLLAAVGDEIHGGSALVRASWLRTHYSPRGRCMFTSCHADGEENSAGLDGCRPTINSVMYGEAVALGAIAQARGLARAYTALSRCERRGVRGARARGRAARWPRPSPRGPAPAGPCLLYTSPSPRD